MNVESDNGIPAADTTPDKPSDNPIDRMIDIALEAQDGPSTTTEGDKNASSTSGEATPKSGEGTPQTQSGDSNSSGSNNTAQQPTNKEGQKEVQQVGGPKDLVLKGQGPNNTDLVIKGGAERRFYEQRETARQQAAHFQQQLTAERQNRERVEAELNTLRQTAQQLNGMDPNALRIGAQIVTDLQRDPVGTMKKLLAEVIAQGHTIEGISTGVDHLAMQRMIDARLPAQQASNEPDDAQILAEAQQEVNNFYAAHPDARPHDALLGRMLRDNPSVDLNTAYFQLKDAFIEKGFDWTRTLEENLQSARSQQQQQPQSNPQQQPMLNGRPVVNAQPANQVKIAHEDTDMSDIIRQAMRENGMQV